MKRALAALGSLAILLPSCHRDPPGFGAELKFVEHGKDVSHLSLAELSKRVPPETFTAYDPYYQRKKTYRALPLSAVLAAGFGRDVHSFQDEPFVLRAKDGYMVPTSGDKLLEPGCYLAIEDMENPTWEPIGRERANPGPVYMVWKNDGQQDLETHPRPWQLASIEVASFESIFPHVVPPADASAPAKHGFDVFRHECVRCHAINREGGHIGPDLNVPQSIVEYRPETQIRAYIQRPGTFRHSNMPPHPGLTDADLDGLIAYFQAMKSAKHDEPPPVAP